MQDHDHILSHYQGLLADHSHGIDWLNTLQNKAFDQLKQTGFPTRQSENWKYTRTTELLKQTFSVNDVSREFMRDNLPAMSAFAELDAHHLVFINGVFSDTLSRLTELPDDVIVCDLHTALAQHENAIHAFLDNNEHDHQSGFGYLNTALMRYGTYIHVPKQRSLDKPVVLSFIATDDASHAFLPIRNLIDLQDDSQACVLEEYTHQSDISYFTSVMTSCQLASHARLDHYKIINDSQKAFHIGHLLAKQQEKSQFNSYSLTQSGQLTRSDTHALLQGIESQCKFYGLFIGKHKHHIDHHTTVEHQVPDTKSDELYKGILTDQSRGVFNGRVFVNEGAAGTDAKQQSHNLLLSKTAEIDTKPQLEIYNDDVKCTHGATVGQLNQNSLFYLQTRGIEQLQAQHLLTLAFASDALKTAENKAILAHLMDLIDMALPTFQEINT